jgi:hypothetical protein
MEAMHTIGIGIAETVNSCYDLSSRLFCLRQSGTLLFWCSIFRAERGKSNTEDGKLGCAVRHERSRSHVLSAVEGQANPSKYGGRVTRVMRAQKHRPVREPEGCSRTGQCSIKAIGTRSTLIDPRRGLHPSSRGAGANTAGFQQTATGWWHR